MRLLKHGTRTMRKWAIVLAAVLAVGLGLTGAASTANAATATAGVTATTSGTAVFASQAKAAGLTSAQAATLQAEVKADIAKLGGTQVAANEIALPHGASLLLPVPGQKVARVLPGAVNLGFYTASSARAAGLSVTTASTARAVRTPSAAGPTMCWVPASITAGTCCPYYYICAWSSTNGYGTQFNASACNVDQELPGSGWNANGSWMNNQTTGTQARFLDKSHQTVYTTAAAFSFDSSYNWYPIWYIHAC